MFKASYANLVKYVIVLSIAVFSSSSIAINDTQSTSENVQMQLVQTAKSATITKINNSKDEYTITLNRVPDYVSYFADRPDRTAGVLPLSVFLQEWNGNNKNSMKNNPPNVAIESMQVDKKGKREAIHIIGVLSEPKYDVKVGKINYRFKLLSSPYDNIPNKISLSYTALFIDGMMIHWGTGPFGH